MGGITDGRFFSDEEIRQQIAENYTRRGEYRDSYMTPAERKEVKDALLALIGALNREIKQSVGVAGLDAEVMQQFLMAAQILVKEF